MTLQSLRRDPRYAAAFATFVCAWALLTATLALSAAPRADAACAPPPVAVLAR
jgi:hypothetical protein